MDEDGINEDQFLFLGYAVVCANCGRKTQLPAASTVAEAKADARSKGCVNHGANWYCDKPCLDEGVSGICRCLYSRSDPHPRKCVKCGKQESN